MIAVDTNLLVFAHRGDAPFHQEALAALRPVFEGPSDVRDVNGAAVTIDTTAAPPQPLGILAGLSDAIPLGLGAFQSAECPNSKAGPLARRSDVNT
ncbi:MAG: hypothetical protein NT167_31330 [Verrucomicrobia bacterium]|nr:hypothetical protein [Verrucomicrobiota bacterium]